ncbi:MAG: thiolase family protein [Candidatus Heimdallarchaeota archaeon]
MTQLDDVVIVSATRSPIGKYGGTLRDLHAPDLAAHTMRAAIDHLGITGFENLIDDVRFGCCVEDNRYMNVSRVAALKAGIPEEIPAVTINRVCTSAMEAVVSGMHQIQADDQTEIILAGGVESMSTIPYLLYDMRWGSRYFDRKIVDGVMAGLQAGGDKLMGLTAEILAKEFRLTREELDIIAHRSHKNALNASRKGKFEMEITAIEILKEGKKIIFNKDEHPRDLSLEELAAMPPVFKKDGIVTAGNSSGINDGAAALILMSQTEADQRGLEPIAKIEGYGIGGVSPDRMGIGPVPAVEKLFSKEKEKKLDDVELIEVNEAFAATYLATERSLGLDREICNVNGSGIGLGHPVGATGTRIIVTLIHEMQKRQKNLGLATLCGGGGLGMAVLIGRD